MIASYHARAAKLKAEPGSPLARARMDAHGSFDMLWKGGSMSRSEAYRWLADQLDLAPEDCHIGFFDAETCDRVRRLCDKRIFMELMDL